MSRHLVTGATGFLGHHLVDALLAQKHEVVALCRKDEPRLRKKGVDVRLGDIVDRESVRAAASGCEALFHCAGKVSRKPEDAEELHALHVDGTKATLEGAREAGVKRAVVASTSGVVAVSRDPDEVRDESALDPMELISGWAYYRSKLFAERAALEKNAPGFSVVAVSPSLLLGPGDLKGSSTGDVVLFLEGKVPVSPAGGVAFVDARDAAAAMLLALERGRGGERYLVSAANMTCEAFLGRLSRISGVAAPRLKMPRSVLLASAGASLLERFAKRARIEAPIDRITAEMGQHFWYVDASKARTVLGWAPRDPLETLADTVADLEARGVVWPRRRPEMRV